ncbi:MAG: hypothetical protein OEY34_02775, partial [Cyclobacteriaceae bacterium]|nr:hypothetical protein [Cyclobacteriaceae bacterium]
LSSPISLLYYGLTHFFGTITSLTILIGGLSFQYFNLVEMKEAKGLMGEIEGITNTETSAEEENETY